MLFTREFKEGIRAGRITRTYRNWKRPQAKEGGRYNLAPDGVIEVERLRRVPIDRVTNADARKAGFSDRQALSEFLACDTAWEVTFRFLGSGRVREPDRTRIDGDELDSLLTRLAAMDARAQAPWTREVLALIRTHPGRRAGDLAPMVGLETPRFKTLVRRLTGLGLTLSLETGYRLSPRGEQVLAAVANR
jgi:hypothetical protein